MIRSTKRNAAETASMIARAKMIEDLKKITDPRKRLDAYNKISGFGTEKEFARKNRNLIQHETRKLAKLNRMYA